MSTHLIGGAVVGCSIDRYSFDREVGAGVLHALCRFAGQELLIYIVSLKKKKKMLGDNPAMDWHPRKD